MEDIPKRIGLIYVETMKANPFSYYFDIFLKYFFTKSMNLKGFIKFRELIKLD